MKELISYKHIEYINNSKCQTYLETVVGDVDVTPTNNEELMRIMTEYAKRDPNIEFGGYIFTNQLGHIQEFIVTTGYERKTPSTPLSFNDRNIDEFHTLVRWHSHPIGSSISFSEDDIKGFNILVAEQSRGLEHPHSRYRRQRRIYVFDAVVNASGEFNWSAKSISIIEVERLMPLLSPEKIGVPFTQKEVQGFLVDKKSKLEKLFP